MTLLELIQTVAREAGLPTGSMGTIVGNTNELTVQLLAIAQRAGKEARGYFRWPELVKDGSATLVAGQESYALPADIDSVTTLSVFNRTNRLPLYGPMTPEEWQSYKAGNQPISTTDSFRIKGLTDKQLFIAPIPTATDAAQVVSFEYQTKSWIRPRTWAASTSFAANTYCFYNGNIYKTTAGGTTGSTAPTHTTGSVSDGNVPGSGVTWTYSTDAYEAFLADTDVVVLDENCMILEIGWRYMREKGLPYAEKRKDAQGAWSQAAGAIQSASRLRLVARRYSTIPYPILPDGWSNV